MTDSKQIIDGKLKETILDFLITISIFDELTPIELSTVADYMNFFELKSGKTLFKEGDRGDYICFTVSGSLDVLKLSAAGRRVVVATLTRGSTIGEMSIIDKISRSATVRATRNCTLLILSQKGFSAILEKHPRIGIKILKGIARLLSLNMRRTTSHLADQIQKAK